MQVDSEPTRTHSIITWSMVILSVITGVLAIVSLAHQKLFTPFGVLATADSGANFYYGISIYITIAVTLLTSALIRFALRITK